MKLQYLANIRLPTEKAHGLQIMKTCEALARAGHEVELVVPSRRNTLTEDPFAYYDVEPRFTITTLPVPDFVRFGRIGFLISALWFSEAARLHRSFWQADVIYSRDALVLAQYVLLGRRLVFEAHGKPSSVEVFIARFAYRLVTISHGIEKAYIAHGVSPKKITVAPDAVDLDAFALAETREEVRRALGLPLDQKLVGYVGKYKIKGKSKGVEEIIAAVGKAHASDERIGLLLVGLEEGEFPDVRERAQGAGLGDAAHLVGHVSRAEVPQYLRAADVLVMNYPNTEHYAQYMSPMKLFEYMASGTPIVSVDLPSVREILDDRAAYFFPPDDTDALAQVMLQALKTPEDAAKRAERARMLAQDYTWEKRAERVLAGVKLGKLG